MYELVIFDLDGTLLNTIGDLSSAMNAALREFGYPERTQAECQSFVGNGIYKLVERSLPKQGATQEEVLKVKQVFDTYYEAHSRVQTKPYEGIVELLKILQQQNIRCGVVTNKTHLFACQLVTHYFGDLVDLVFGQRPQIPAKPHPHSVQEMIAYFNVAPDKCLYIGDSDVDIQTAKAANLTSVGVCWGFRSRAVLEKAGADYIVEDAHALLKLILK